MTNCPNCGAPIEPYKCKCEYCGTWYFDFAAFDLADGVPCYVKFKTNIGVITTLAKPEFMEVETGYDDVCVGNSFGDRMLRVIKSRWADFTVVFHCLMHDNQLFTLEVPIGEEHGKNS